ncbi:arginase family protein [Desulfospira joergensenii]|uniref:arginase family protein n=1 Tax=Desulfospira joergensenii TaxID=53329 RepID=UPI0003B44441|nr:arginase family protein [Desulfospira joergensenii]
MRLDHTRHLNLLFPQWQGSGPSNLLYHGANALGVRLEDLDFKTIPVPESESLEKKHQILGYASILSQLNHAAALIESHSPKSILVVGGDCSVELAPISFLNRVLDNSMGLVWLDAHPDLNTPESSPSAHFHGMPLRALLGETHESILARCFSILSPDQVILAGIRDMDLSEQEYIQKKNITSISVQQMENDPGILSETVLKKSFSRIYIHIDLDVLDPAIYPFVKHPTPMGMRPDTLAETIRLMNDIARVDGLGLVEFTAVPPEEIQKKSLSWHEPLTRIINLFRPCEEN